MIIRREVPNSTAISAFEYDTETQILSIKFTSGGVYDYPGLPEDIVRNWMIAESMGRYFNQNIKNYSAHAV